MAGRPIGLPLLLTILFSFFAATSSAQSGDRPRYLDTTDYAADPAAHVFEGKIHVYCTRDWKSPVTDRTDGNHYDMREYSHFEVDPRSGEAIRTDSILVLEQVPWAARQLWACDVACKEGRYYLYFPAKDRDGLFRIGVAVADRPEGPFAPDPEPIPGTYSIDPAVFEDEGEYYLYFGGLQGGQLQRYADNRPLERERMPAAGEEALAARVARLSDDMHALAEESRPVILLDAEGRPLKADDPHRFFEAAWMHKHAGTYYFTYSTGSGHEICYATGDNPYGPFTYRGVVLTPVVGWTTHQSICETAGQWYLFYHDSAISGGVSSLRSAKYCELVHEPDGSIRTVEGKPGRGNVKF
ncbi:MAG: family 43 glycosylhydrolase [Alistipes sp.]|nr:family 43 glycosylhydrolase [Alistipes sp.]